MVFKLLMNSAVMQIILKTFLVMRILLVTDSFKDSSDIEVFKNKVRQSFQSKAVEVSNQHFKISGFDKVKDQVKFYMKIKDDKKAIEAILNLKTDNILLMKVHKKKPNS